MLELADEESGHRRLVELVTALSSVIDPDSCLPWDHSVEVLQRRAEAAAAEQRQAANAAAQEPHNYRRPLVRLPEHAYSSDGAYDLVRQARLAVEDLLSTYLRVTFKLDGGASWGDLKHLDGEVMLLLRQVMGQVGLLHHWHEMYPCHNDGDLRCTCPPVTMSGLLDETSGRD